MESFVVDFGNAVVSLIAGVMFGLGRWSTFKVYYGRLYRTLKTSAVVIATDRGSLEPDCSNKFYLIGLQPLEYYRCKSG